MYTGPARKGWTSLKCEIQPKAGFHTYCTTTELWCRVHFNSTCEAGGIKVFTPKLPFGVKVKSFHCKFTVRCKHLTLLHWLGQCSKFAMEVWWTTTYACGDMWSTPQATLVACGCTNAASH